MGHQPLNLASPLATLAEAGLKAEAVDTSVTPLTSEKIKAAWFIAISIPMHTATRLALSLISQIKAINPQAYLCCYGLYATLNADYLLEQGVNFLIGGEFEEPLKALIFSLKRGSVVEVAGVTTTEIFAPPYINKIPFLQPDRSALPSLDHYAHLEMNGQRLPGGYAETSRGCLHTCLHCPITPIYQGRFFVIPAEIVLADIDTQVQMGAKHITFGDPDFLNGPGHVMKIVRAMHQKHPHLTFDITVKIEHILKYPHHLAELKGLGCVFVVSAVESFSDVVLDKLNKGHSRADIQTALALLQEIDLPLRPSLVAFTPWGTLNDYLDMLEQIEALGLIDQLDPVQYTIRLLVPPGSALLNQPDTAEWLGPLDAPNLSYRWNHPDPKMDDLHRQVSDLVANANSAGEATRITFYRLKALAYAVALGRPAPAEVPLSPAADLAPAPTPKLTENWFC